MLLSTGRGRGTRGQEKIEHLSCFREHLTFTSCALSCMPCTPVLAFALLFILLAARIRLPESSPISILTIFGSPAGSLFASAAPLSFNAPRSIGCAEGAAFGPPFLPAPAPVPPAAGQQNLQHPQKRKTRTRRR